MKTLQTLILILAICFSANTNAQLLKKLKKKAAEAAERSIEYKVEEKTEKETSKAFDTVFNNQGKLFKKEKAIPAEFYAFSHRYVMQIDDEKNKTNINYYLTNQGDYIGSSVDLKENEEMLTVMDLSKQTAHMFMDLNGQKSKMSFGLNLESIAEDTMETSDIEIKPSGNSKFILGYNCLEYIVKGKNFNGSVWVTDEADVSFSKSFYRMKNKKFKASKNMDQSWLSTIEGLTLETVMTDTSKKKSKTVTMTCTALDEIEYIIETAQYN